MRTVMKVRRLGGAPAPLVPFEADAIAWLDAESLVGVYANGDPVPSWPATIDAANGSAAQSGVGAIPSFDVDVDGSGKAGVVFNGSSHYLILGDTWKLPPAGEYTVYTVVRRSSTLTAVPFCWASGGATNGGFAFQFVSSNQTSFRVGGTNSGNLAATWSNGTRAVATLTNVDAGGGYSAHVNSTQVFTTASNGSTTSATRPLLAARWTNEAEAGVGLLCNCTIQAVLAYSTEHGATERAAVLAFLYSRYGVVP